MAVIGRYEVVQKVGEGGMGVVLVAKDPLLGRSVAIKVISKRATAQSDWLRARFMQEARVIALLNHPAIVSIFDVGEHEGQPYIVMEYVPGQSLYNLLRLRPLKPAEIIGCVKTVASALDYAHAQHVIHRDIKPANLLVSHTGMLKVTDFGVAKLVTASENTNTGVLGTLSYMAPEQFKRVAQPQSDQYSLAALTYELLAGRPVFEAESEAALVYKICNEPPEPPNVVRPDIQIEASRVLKKALSKEPADRFPSCAAFARALEAGMFGRVADHSSAPKPASPVKTNPRSEPADTGPVRVPSFATEATVRGDKVLLIGAAAVLCAGVMLWPVFHRSSHVVPTTTVLPHPVLNSQTDIPPRTSLVTSSLKPSQTQTHTTVPGAAKPAARVNTSIRRRPSALTGVSPASLEAGRKAVAQEQKTNAQVPSNAQDGKNDASAPEADSSQNSSSSSSVDGRLVWTGILEPGQQIDLSRPSDGASVSGSLPGVPVTIDVHPSTVRVVTPPGPGNGWRRIVVQNDNTRRSLVLVRWSIIQR